VAKPKARGSQIAPQVKNRLHRRVGFDGREVVYGFGELDKLVLAYATTIHKSQGSEYPAVVIPLSTQHYPMLRRNLLYTGVTRGRRLVVIVGQRRAIGIAVRGGQSIRRWSRLREWLECPTPGACAGMFVQLRSWGPTGVVPVYE
jgi:ATP-dependent exoDNAse (exonuclease V) alpha subunit